MLRLFQYLWAGPNTLLALAVACGLWGLSLVFKPTHERVKFSRVEGVLEICGGLVSDCLRLMPTSGSWREPTGAAALTLGHVVFATDPSALDRTRIHERVHVRQYERWGSLFIPAYLVATWVAKCRGRHGYLANTFEQEAYAVSHPASIKDA